MSAAMTAPAKRKATSSSSEAVAIHHAASTVAISAMSDGSGGRRGTAKVARPRAGHRADDSVPIIAA